VLELSFAEAGVMPKQLHFTGHVSLEEQGGLTVQTETRFL
jgi:hypothetical protein